MIEEINPNPEPHTEVLNEILSAQELVEFHQLEGEAHKEFPSIFGAHNLGSGKPDIDLGSGRRMYWRRAVYHAGNIVAIIGAYRDQSKEPEKSYVAVLTDFYVKPSFRKRGIGEQVFLSILNQLEQDFSVKKVSLAVSLSQKEAIRIYRMHGFKMRRIPGNDEEVEFAKIMRK